jgi:hypothetical protein
MGKVLTVESRIKKFTLKSVPLAAAKYYNINHSYENLLLTFTEQLIKANDFETFLTFLEDQARLYLFDSLIAHIIKCSCRYSRPKMAVYAFFLSIKSQTVHKFND